jgi:hypothetical protein
MLQVGLLRRQCEGNALQYAKETNGNKNALEFAL